MGRELCSGFIGLFSKNSLMANDPNKFIPVCQLAPNVKNINIQFIVLEVGPPRRTPQGNDVRTIRVADPTGSVLMTVWNEVGNFVAESDIWRLRNGYTSVYKGVMSLSCGKLGEMVKTGEFFMIFSETPNMSEYNAEWAAKFPIPRKGSPDEETGNGAGGGNGGRAAPSDPGTSAQPQQQRQHPLSAGHRGGGVKRAGIGHMAGHRAKPAAPDVPRKVARI